MDYTLLGEDLEFFEAAANNFKTCVRNLNLLGSEYWLRNLTGICCAYWTHMGKHPTEEECKIVWSVYKNMQRETEEYKEAYAKLRRQILYPSCQTNWWESF